MQDFRETVLLGRAVGSPCQLTATMLRVPLVPVALYCVSNDGIHLFLSAACNNRWKGDKKMENVVWKGELKGKGKDHNLKSFVIQ